MRIHLSIENPTPDLLRLLAGTYSTRDLDPDFARAGAAENSPSVEPKSSEAAPAETAAPASPPAPNETSTSSDADGQSKADELIAKLSGERKRAKTVTLSGGAQGSDGDYVKTNDGETGIIEACFRGLAVVSFEDGSADAFPAANLTKVEEPGGEDQTAADTAAAPAEGRRRRRSDDGGEQTIPQKFAGLDKDVAQSILDEFEMKSIDEYGELEGDDKADFDDIVNEEAGK